MSPAEGQQGDLLPCEQVSQVQCWAEAAGQPDRRHQRFPLFRRARLAWAVVVAVRVEGNGGGGRSRSGHKGALEGRQSSGA